ncbi:MAG: MATE family efflux transporter [bacterium]|nr:MATE family efflux transporter [bacterium]
MAKRPLPDLLNGPVTSTLVNLSFPLAGAMLLNSALGVVDLIYVGLLGKEALAAVALCFPLHFLIISIGAGTSDAISAVLARYFGAGDKEHTERVALYAAFAWLGLTALMMPLGLILARPLLESTGADPAVVEMANDYACTLYWGAGAILGQMMMGGLYRGGGDTRFPFWNLLLAVICNAVLDPLFIFGLGPFPRLGVYGAALATVLSRVIGMGAFSLHLFRRKGPIHFNPKALRWDPEAYSRLWRLAVPGFIQRGIMPVAIQVVLYLITPLGVAVVAAYGVVQRLFGLIQLPAIGFGSGTMVMIGQCHGAGLPDRARHTSMASVWVTTLITGGLTVLIWFFAPFFVSLFSDSPEVTRAGALMMRWLVVAQPAAALIILVNGYFNAMGRGLYAMLPTIGQRLILEPGGLALGLLLGGMTGAWAGMMAGGLVAGGVSLLVLFNRWRALRREAGGG